MTTTKAWRFTNKQLGCAEALEAHVCVYTRTFSHTRTPHAQQVYNHKNVCDEESSTRSLLCCASSAGIPLLILLFKIILKQLLNYTA